MRFLWLTGLLCLFNAAAAQAGETEPAIAVTGSDTINFGQCLRGDTIEAVFHFRVSGSGRLMIRQVHPGCQCTVPLYPADSMASGHEDSIVLAFHSKNVHAGPVEKYAIVINSGPERIFWLKGTVIEQVPASRRPHRLRLSNVNPVPETGK